MTKTERIIRYFQRKDLLTPSNQAYSAFIDSFVQLLSKSDTVSDDLTSKTLELHGIQEAIVLAHEEGILSGLEEINYICQKQLGLSIFTRKHDGDTLQRGERIASLTGDISTILSWERIILNIIQRMSGIATQTRKLVDLASPLMVSATRKTPWMMLDKKAVSVGGGLTHRLSLSDGILVKDNHIEAMKKAVNLQKDEHVINTILSKITSAEILQSRNDFCIEIEVKTEKEALAFFEAIKQTTPNHQFALLLDNFNPKEAQTLIERLKVKYSLDDVIIEASGCINDQNITQWAKPIPIVDFVSLGSLTHSSRALDISLEIV